MAGNKQTLGFKLGTEMRLSPQQIMLMQLIQMNTTSLEQKIKEEIIENPSLEEGKDEDEEEVVIEIDEPVEEEITELEQDKDEIMEEYLGEDDVPEWKTKTNNHSKDDEEKQVPLAGGISFLEFLIGQLSLSNLSEDEFKVAQFIIGSLEDDGYLKRPLLDLLDDLAFKAGVYTTQEEIEKVLGVIQELDPPGVGARDLRECLILQLERQKATSARVIALTILDDYFDDFEKKHFEKLIAKLNITEGEFREAIDEIKHLNPKPGNAAPNNSRPTQYVIPDFILAIENGEVSVSLNSKDAPELHVSNSFKSTIDHYKKSKGKVSRKEKDDIEFIKSKINSAKWFIDAIKQRQHTLQITMNSIVKRQKAYFLTGDEKELRPMILKDIADEIGMDISTVSRVANSKSVQTPYGTFLVKTLFSESMPNAKGEVISTKAFKKTLEEIIEEEDKSNPFTDEALVQKLKEKGYPIARRTVAKYREQLGLPVARMRKEANYVG